MIDRPNIVLYNLQNAGSSALDPVLREVLSALDYELVPFGPEASGRLVDYLRTARPIYHWTHDPIETFRQMGIVGRRDWRFIVLHRDIRDVAVSLTKDMLQRGIYENISENMALYSTLAHPLPGFVKNTEGWIDFVRCRPDLSVEVRFDQMKSDMNGTIAAILDKCKLHCDGEVVLRAINTHSFENVTGRNRGEEGTVVRTGYLYRKGVSGEWRSHFGIALKDFFEQHLGDALIRLGWEKDHAWGPRGAYLVSAPFGSGVAWLVNVLLELGVRLTHANTVAEHWIRSGDQYTIAPASFDHLQWHLPVLGKQTVFTFAEDVEVIWEHRLDFIRHYERDYILYTRDPRDAIYSLYCRNYQNDISLGEYLVRPDEWPDHFPGMFGLPPPETWAYFHLFWLAMQPYISLYVVRFEEMRNNPVQVTQGVLQALGVSREDCEITRALEESNFNKAKIQMERLHAQTGRQFATARKGQVGEWREVYSAAELEAFEGPCLYAMSQLGYSDVEASESNVAILSYEDHKGRNSVVRFVLDKFEQDMNAGEFENAVRVIGLAFMVEGLEKENEIWLAAIFCGINWARRMVSNMPHEKFLARRVVETFAEINMAFNDHRAVRTLLRSSIEKGRKMGQEILTCDFARIQDSLRIGDFGTAEQILRKLTDDAPCLTKVYVALASLLAKLNKVNDSRVILQKGIAMCHSKGDLMKLLLSLPAEVKRT